MQTWQKLQELVFTEGGWVKTGDHMAIRLRAKGVEGYKPVGIGVHRLERVRAEVTVGADR